jgi:hypothetical protein
VTADTPAWYGQAIINATAVPLGLHFAGPGDPGHDLTVCSPPWCGRTPQDAPPRVLRLDTSRPQAELLEAVDTTLAEFEENLNRIRVDLDRMAGQLTRLRRVAAAARRV